MSKTTLNIIHPFLIGLAIAAILNISIGWWSFWVIFPWIGLSISIGMLLSSLLKGKKRIIGRKTAILMILPCLLIFIPIINNENFQLEGVVLIVLVGFSVKGLYIMRLPRILSLCYG